MKNNILKRHLTLLAVSLCVCLLFVFTTPEVGRTDGVRANADAYAYQYGQNWFWSTFKSEAYADVYAPEGTIGVYQLEAAVTGKNTKRTQQLPFFDGTTKDTQIRNSNTYRAWGSGSNVRFSASSEAYITSNAGDDDADYAQYPSP